MQVLTFGTMVWLLISVDELERKRKFHEERGEKGPGKPH